MQFVCPQNSKLIRIVHHLFRHPTFDVDCFEKVSILINLMRLEHTISIFEVLMLVVHHVLLVERLSDLMLSTFITFSLSIAVTSAVSHILIYYLIITNQHIPKT